MNETPKAKLAWVAGIALIILTVITQYSTTRVLEGVDLLSTEMVGVRKDVQHLSGTLDRIQSEQNKHRGDIEDLKLRIALIEREREMRGVQNVN